MVRAAKHMPESMRIAEALENEFMRAVEIHYPTPRDPLYDVGAKVTAVGDKFAVHVHPVRTEEYSHEQRQQFDRAESYAHSVVQAFLSQLGISDAPADRGARGVNEWVAKLNTYFSSQGQQEITNPLLIQRGRTHA